MVTSDLFQPAAFGAGLACAEIVGGVRSMAKVTLALAVLPALSTACPVTTWLAPSVLTATGAGQLAIPEVASVQVNVTVTLVLFQPPGFTSGFTAAVMVGGSLSTPMMSTAREPPGL